MAEKAGAFLRDHMVDSSTGIMLRSLYGSGDSLEQLGTPIQGFLEDYANTVQAMLDLYTATLDESWLEMAEKLQKTQDNLFLDKAQGGYFASREGDPEIVLRLKDDQDGAEPSSNSVSAMNLLRLGKILNNKKYSLEAEKIIKLFSERLEQIPHAMPALVDAYLYMHQAEPILVVTGELSSSNPVFCHIKSSHLPSHSIVSGGPMVKSAHPALSKIDWEQPGVHLLSMKGDLSGQ